MIQVGTKPLQVVLTADPVKVYNVGTVPIYYKVGSPVVSSTSNDGEIAANKNKYFSLPTWIVAKEPGAQVRLEEPDANPTSPTYARAREKAEFYVTSVPFEVQNDGVTDDTAALQVAVNAARECEAVVPPGLGCLIKSPINLPEQANIRGVNRETSVIVTEGDISAFQTKGANRIKDLEFQCKAEQTVAAKEKGAIDFSTGTPNNIWIKGVRIGSNYYNGIYGVGSAEGGGIHLSEVEASAISTRTKGMKGAFIVLGSKAVRLIGVWLDDINIEVNANTEATTGVEINNVDSAHIHRVLAVNCKKGIVVGNNDNSAKRTTNLFMHDVQADGCNLGFELRSITEGARFDACTAEGCGTGWTVGAEVGGVGFANCASFKNEGEGFVVLAKTVNGEYSNQIVGCQFHGNGTNAEAAKAGLYFEEETGGFIVASSSFGNPKSNGTTQKLGVRLGKKTDKIQFIGNRFIGNVTEPIKKDTEETNINGKSAPTFAELEAFGNFKV